ncbi:MAG: transketolase [Atribacterota bacterium]|nr:transketolase [Atribacterota bacterium]
MLKDVANIIRGLSVDAVEKANSGHPGLPLGCAEIGAVLFGEILKHDPGKPDWVDRDRFVLSAGHGSALLYALLHLSGYELSIQDIMNFRKINSKTPGHPEYRHTPGLETTSGPLGQGFANAVGMALAEKMLAARFNDEGFNIFDHYTYVLAGDGCMMEGITSEAASLAGHLGLGKLIVVYDQNFISLAAETEVTFTESVAERFQAYNWQVITNINGHDIDELKSAFIKAKEDNNRPTIIIAKTHIGFGAPTKQDTPVAHGAPLGKDEVEGLKKNIGLPLSETFYISQKVREYFKNTRFKLQKERELWEERFNGWAKKFPQKKMQWQQGLSLEIPENLDFSSIDFNEKTATRNASGKILNFIAEKIPYLVGGSADLSPSTKTYLNNFSEVQKNFFQGRNIRFGVREHAMAAICNGISLHKGLRPYCSTFLVFSDYMRPAIRLSALMNLPIIYIFTHDSIYVGEDGPTHQPVEHLESLRMIPNLKVIRPADSEEVKAAWQIILEKNEGPTALILSRQDLPKLQNTLDINDFRMGGYIVSKKEIDPDVVIIASGSEAETALQVQKILENENISCRIISMPDREEFAGQNENYQKKLLGKENNIKVIIEASSGQGWYEVISNISLGIFIRSFGISGPGEEVAKELGFDAAEIAKKIINIKKYN